jgi:hypothetical protein
MRCVLRAVFVLAILCVPGFALPRFTHVVIVVEENHNYSGVIGNSSMPYLNRVAHKYGLATQYYANVHPSIGNYFMLTTGGLITNNDTLTATVNADNVVRHLLTARAGRGKPTKRACLMPVILDPTPPLMCAGTVHFLISPTWLTAQSRK